MSQHKDVPRTYSQEVRDVVIKSSLSGVAATVLAVTLCSPAGLGGMIGTSLASGFGLGPERAPTDDVYASFPAYPSPLSRAELEDIRDRLAQTSASLAITRAATEAKIEYIRSVTTTNSMSLAPMTEVARIDAGSTVVQSELVTEFAPVEELPAEGSHLELASLLLDYE